MLATGGGKIKCAMLHNRIRSGLQGRIRGQNWRKAEGVIVWFRNRITEIIEQIVNKMRRIIWELFHYPV